MVLANEAQPDRVGCAFSTLLQLGWWEVGRWGLAEVTHCYSLGEDSQTYERRYFILTPVRIVSAGARRADYRQRLTEVLGHDHDCHIIRVIGASHVRPIFIHRHLAAIASCSADASVTT